MKRSTGLRNYLLASGSLRQALAGTVIRLYSGTAPADADAPLTAATLLCTVSVDGEGGGVTLADAASGGVITKNPSELWEGEVVANGRAAFFRMCTPADDGASSTTAIRLQGSVGLVGADLNFSNIDLLVGDTRRIQYFAAGINAG